MSRLPVRLGFLASNHGHRTQRFGSSSWKYSFEPPSRALFRERADSERTLTEFVYVGLLVGEGLVDEGMLDAPC